MADPLTLGFVPLARKTFDTALAAEISAQGRAMLEGAGFHLAGPSELVTDLETAWVTGACLAPQALDLLVILQSTFADSTMVVGLAETVEAPLLLWAVPEAGTGGRLRLNSLCGINLAAHALTRRRRSYDTLYAGPDDHAALRQINTLARAGRVRRLLRQARVGRVGENPAGFDSCLVNTDALYQQLGLEVVPVRLDAVFKDVRATPAAAIEAVRHDLQLRVQGLDAVDQAALRGTLGTYGALRGLARQESLHGLAVRCWPEFFDDLGCAACGAMSMLSDTMTPCSCEADVNGTITQLILQWLSGEPAFGADLVSVDRERDGIVLWHCGLAPLSMADPETPARATVHSNRGLPLLMEFTLKPGRVTIARLSEANGALRLVVGSGTMVKAPPQFSGTSGVLRFDRPATEILDTILNEGLEHHLSIAYGDHLPELHTLARYLDLPILEL